MKKLNSKLFEEVFTSTKFNLSHNEKKHRYYSLLDADNKRIYTEWENKGWISRVARTDFEHEFEAGSNSLEENAKDDRTDETDDEYKWFKE